MSGILSHQKRVQDWYGDQWKDEYKNVVGNIFYLRSEISKKLKGYLLLEEPQFYIKSLKHYNGTIESLNTINNEVLNKINEIESLIEYDLDYIEKVVKIERKSDIFRIYTEYVDAEFSRKYNINAEINLSRTAIRMPISENQVIFHKILLELYLAERLKYKIIPEDVIFRECFALDIVNVKSQPFSYLSNKCSDAGLEVICENSLSKKLNSNKNAHKLYSLRSSLSLPNAFIFHVLGLDYGWIAIFGEKRFIVAGLKLHDNLPKEILDKNYTNQDIADKSLLSRANFSRIKVDEKIWRFDENMNLVVIN